MFCSKCGSKNEDGASFCVNCGNPLSNNNYSASNTNNAKAYISNLPPIITELKKLDYYDQNINKIQSNISLKRKQIKSAAFSFIIALLATLFVVTPIVFSIILSFSGILFDEKIKDRFGYSSVETPESIFDYDAHKDYVRNNNAIKSAKITYSLEYTLFFDIFTYGVLLCILNIIRKKSNNRNYEMIAKFETDLTKEAEKKTRVMKSLTPVIHILPPNYRYALAAEYIYNCFLNSRAYTIQEAVNLYEEQLHRWRIENAQGMMLALQRQQNSDINTMKIFTGITAAASVATAINTR